MLLQTQKTALKPLTTAHLAQTMSLLELSSEELRQEIDSVLASNPALELLDEVRCPNCQRPLSGNRRCPICSSPKTMEGDEPIVFVSPRTDFAPSRKESYQDDLPIEEWTAAVEDLPTYVLRQIAPELAAEDRQIAAHLISSLDDDGLLTIPIVEIARYYHVPISRVKMVQELVQRSDPIGVGSNSPREALLVQIKVLEESRPIPALAVQAIEEGMDLLSRHAYSELGRKLNVSAKDASAIAEFIGRNLNPYPARAHWGESYSNSDHNHLFKDPDIIISSLYNTPDSPLIVEIVSPYVGSLHVNPLFRKAISEAPSEKSERWQSDYDKAVLLVKCIQQRNNTLVRMMQRLVTLQRDFILKGNAHLIPVTRAQIAEELEVHESTISRAVSGKAVQLPNNKIIPLSKWFDRSLHVRTEIIKIVSQESKPLSDTQIAELLSDKGYDVARRTVAKYRSMEGILPARLRQPNRA